MTETGNERDKLQRDVAKTQAKLLAAIEKKTKVEQRSHSGGELQAAIAHVRGLVKPYGDALTALHEWNEVHRE